jgi:DNA-binding NarL/FixJ family response regulator
LPPLTRPSNVLLVIRDADATRPLTDALADAAMARCCGVASTLADGIEQFRTTTVDAVVVQLTLPGLAGLQAVDVFRAIAPDVAIVALAKEPDAPVLREAMRIGVSGIASLDAPAAGVVALCRAAVREHLLVEGMTAARMAETAGSPTLRTTPRRGPSLTPRESEVLELLGRGFDTSAIAEQLGLSVHTARGHVKKILAKLHAHTQLEAVINASELGLLPNLRHR